MLSFDEMADLAQGSLLTFGASPQVYTVLEVQHPLQGLRLTLKRDDGYETFAVQGDLDVATLYVPPKPIVDTSSMTLTDAPRKGKKA